MENDHAATPRDIEGAAAGADVIVVGAGMAGLVTALRLAERGLRVVIIEQDEDGAWVAVCPGLPGCISQGASEAEARANLCEAMEAFHECLARRGEALTDCLGGDET